MSVSYKKLWKLLIDRDMKKKDLAQLAGISNFTISKMSAGNNVTVEVLGKICKALCYMVIRQFNFCYRKETSGTSLPLVSSLLFCCIFELFYQKRSILGFP